MEKLLRFVLHFLAATTVFVALQVHDSTSLRLGCLHESQCQEAFGGEYCCPAKTCCHFFVVDSNKIMSRCKRSRHGQTTFCQDKILLNDQALEDPSFLTEYPPNKGKTCITRGDPSKVHCFGGTDSEEEEWKASGRHLTKEDVTWISEGNKPIIVFTRDGYEKAIHNMHFSLNKTEKRGWFYKGKRMWS